MCANHCFEDIPADEVEAVFRNLPLNELVGKTDKILERVEKAKVSAGFGLSQEYRQELLKVYLKRSIKALGETF